MSSGKLPAQRHLLFYCSRFLTYDFIFFVIEKMFTGLAETLTGCQFKMEGRKPGAGDPGSQGIAESQILKTLSSLTIPRTSASPVLGTGGDGRGEALRDSAMGSTMHKPYILAQ